MQGASSTASTLGAAVAHASPTTGGRPPGAPSGRRPPLDPKAEPHGSSRAAMKTLVRDGAAGPSAGAAKGQLRVTVVLPSNAGMLGHPPRRPPATCNDGACVHVPHHDAPILVAAGQPQLRRGTRLARPAPRVPAVAARFSGDAWLGVAGQRMRNGWEMAASRAVQAGRWAGGQAARWSTRKPPAATAPVQRCHRRLTMRPRQGGGHRHALCVAHDYSGPCRVRQQLAVQGGGAAVGLAGSPRQAGQAV